MKKQRTCMVHPDCVYFSNYSNPTEELDKCLKEGWVVVGCNVVLMHYSSSFLLYILEKEYIEEELLEEKKRGMLTGLCWTVTEEELKVVCQKEIEEERLKKERKIFDGIFGR